MLYVLWNMLTEDPFGPVIDLFLTTDTLHEIKISFVGLMQNTSSHGGNCKNYCFLECDAV
jgi:hypothetical protein